MRTKSSQFRNSFFLLGFYILFCGYSFADDSMNPNSLTLKAIFLDKEFKTKSFGPIRWLRDGSGYTTLETSDEYSKVQDGAENDKKYEAKEIVHYDPQTGERKVLVAASQLIPKDEEKPLEIKNYIWSDDSSKLLIFTNTERVWRHHTRGDYWVLNLENNKLVQIGGDAEESMLMFAKFSPDASCVGYVYKNNVYVQNLKSMRVRQITKDGSNRIINGTSDWVYEEEFGLRDAFRWSPDGRFIAYWQFDTQGVQTFHLINYTDALYPKIKSFKYPKVGQTNSACRLGVISAKGGPTSWIPVKGDSRNHYIPRMEWIPDKNKLMFQRLNRLQNTNEVMTCQVKSNWLGQPKCRSLKTLFTDKDDAWLDVNNDIKWLGGNRCFTWLSEQDGWRHLYTIDIESGELQKLTLGDFDIINVLSVNEAKEWVYFIASPDDPLRRYLYRCPLDGSGSLERITPANYLGNHSYQISNDTRWAIHTYSAMGKIPVIDMVSLPDHTSVQILEDNAELRKKYSVLKGDPGEFFQVDIGNGILLDGWCIKPPDFDSNKKYPLLFYVYGEPAGQTVKDRWGNEKYLWHRFLAQEGYVVMSVDNRGTAAPRGRTWRKCIYRQIGILASKEQALAAQKIIETHAYIDKNRVGIWGWSGGGSMTLNMLFRYPDIYMTGIAIAFTANQRYYDTIYQERYMGLPADNDEGFTNGSPITFAHQLEGDLLIIHGTADDNGHFQNCLALINKLIEHNKQFSTMIYPNRSHSLSEGQNTQYHHFTTMTKFLNEKLWQ